MDKQCIKCGYDKCDSAIEFHHIDLTTKLFNIGAQWIANKDKIELEKCATVLFKLSHRISCWVIWNRRKTFNKVIAKKGLLSTGELNWL